MMQEIIDRYPSKTVYLFPILTETENSAKMYQQYRYGITRYNSCLKQLGEMLGHLKLTSYVSRHSWATTAHRQHVPLPIISQSMGHDSERTTEIYLKSLEGGVIHRAKHFPRKFSYTIIYFVSKSEHKEKGPAQTDRSLSICECNIYSSTAACVVTS
ncbi:MAG: tyrosine-type recombinase/integrase [Bacteroidaceae bacterium]|nr:tyrosine-type recombinase/integrase [Bacteroidaceae bacterium]